MHHLVVARGRECPAGNPHVVARGDVGPLHYIHGAYLQDWLLKDTDYSWRLEPDAFTMVLPRQ